MLSPIVNGNCEPNHVRNYHRSSGPRPDWPPTVRCSGRLYLPKKVIVDKRPFLDRAWHERDPPLYLRRFLRRTIIVEVLLFRRVLWPLVGTPQGVTGCRPPEDRPSPPPCGWSTGFIATPRTVGLRPRQRAAPALPSDRRECSGLPTSPTVARHSTGTLRNSPDRSRKVANRPSRATNCTLAPALRAICAPFPGLNSTQCTVLPTGISLNSRQLPGRIGTPRPDINSSPVATPRGAII